MVPARSESHVVGCTVYRDLKSAWSTWVSKPGSPREEQRVARAIVPDRCRYVPLLIMNVASLLLLLAFACLVKPYDGCFVSTVECSQSAL